MKRQFVSFLIRWALNAFGLWVSVRILGSFGAAFTGDQALTAFLFAGFIFSIVNAVLRPIIIILSLPAILLTLGLFMLVVNGILVWISIKLAPGIDMSFAASIIAGIIMGLINYIVTGLIDHRGSRKAEA
jgi:putative membrane protein